MDSIPSHLEFSEAADQFFFVPLPKEGGGAAAGGADGVESFLREVRERWPGVKGRAREKERWWENGGSLDFTVTGRTGSGVSKNVRSLICPCEGGKFLSVSCRLEGGKSSEAPTSTGPDADTNLAWAPDGTTKYGPLSIETLAKKLCECLHEDEVKEGGVIVIAGATSAGKSQLAEAMLYYSLVDFRHDRPAKEARGHVLTVESPVGKAHLVKQGGAYLGPEKEPKWGERVCATRRLLPRTGPRDAVDLRQVLEIDARRQHPKAVYVDEIREDRDWKYLIDFGLTRHLAITTTHASTLPETIARISRATGCRNPDQRARLGRALLCVIHLDAFEVEPNSADSDPYKAIFPAVWTRGKSTTAGLAWPWISSVVPRCPEPKAVVANEAGSCLGRSYFAASLDVELRAGLMSKFEKAPGKGKGFVNEKVAHIGQLARERDLFGY